MIRKKEDPIEWLQFELLGNFPELIHGVFLRRGGLSQEAFSSLNFSRSVGDEGAHVSANIEIVKSVLKIPTIVSSKNIHGTQIDFVNSTSLGEIAGSDGLMTDEKGVGLMVKHADCQAIILFDPVRLAIANIHVGWRGNVQEIIQKAVESMVGRFNSRAENLLACISPSLGPTAAEFKNYKEEFPEKFWPFRIGENSFNLWELSKQQLLNAGLLPHHIEIAALCTYSNPQDYFSYRRDKICGRNGTVVCLSV